MSKMTRCIALGAALALAGAAHAETVSQYGHDLKNDATHLGHKTVEVGKDTGHAVVHAGKVVGHDVAQGARHGYRKVRHEVRKLHSRASTPKPATQH
jgi:hypothetical protein